MFDDTTKSWILIINGSIVFLLKMTKSNASDISVHYNYEIELLSASKKCK